MKLILHRELLWDKKFEDAGMEFEASVQLTNDGGYIFTGRSRALDVLLLKTNSEGEILWEKTFGTSKYYEAGCSVQKTSDGGYIIVGVSLSFCSDTILIKTNSNGDKEWIKYYGGRFYDYGLSVQQTSDDGYIITGYKTAGIYYDVWLLKTDENGNGPKSRARNLMKLKLFELFPNLFPILQTLLLQRFGLQ